MDLGLKDKVALVTGASSGIGRAASVIFAQEGAKVVCVARNEERLKDVVNQIKQEGGEATYYICDVNDEAQVKAMVDYAIKTYGKLDCAFNNAGIVGGSGMALHETPNEVFDSLIETNMHSYFLCMKHEIPYMLKNGKGAIVNTGSINSVTATKYGCSYTTSKYALYGLSQAAALDYADKNIRINILGPGITNTPMIATALQMNPAKINALMDRIPDKTWGAPEQQARMAVYLCSDAAEHINGTLVLVDGGQHAVQ